MVCTKMSTPHNSSQRSVVVGSRGHCKKTMFLLLPVSSIRRWFGGETLCVLGVESVWPLFGTSGPWHVYFSKLTRFPFFLASFPELSDALPDQQRTRGSSSGLLSSASPSTCLTFCLVLSCKKMFFRICYSCAVLCAILHVILGLVVIQRVSCHSFYWCYVFLFFAALSLLPFCVSEEDCKPIEINEATRWKPKSLEAKTAGGEEAASKLSTDEVLMKANAILNKVSPLCSERYW